MNYIHAYSHSLEGNIKCRRILKHKNRSWGVNYALGRGYGRKYVQVHKCRILQDWLVGVADPAGLNGRRWGSCRITDRCIFIVLTRNCAIKNLSPSATPWAAKDVIFKMNINFKNYKTPFFAKRGDLQIKNQPLNSIHRRDLKSRRNSSPNLRQRLIQVNFNTYLPLPSS